MIRKLEFRKLEQESIPSIQINPDELLLLFVRHGISQEDLDNKYCGWCDSPMVPEGRQEIIALLPTLDSVPYSVVYSDDLQRTTESARILAADKAQVVQLKGLRPWGVGTELSGKVKTKTNEMAVQNYVDHPNEVPAGDQAESINESIARWNSAFTYVISQSKPGTAVVLSVHSNAHKILRTQFLGQAFKGTKREPTREGQVALKTRRKFKLGHGGLMAFRLRKDGNATIDILAQGRLEDSERMMKSRFELRNAVEGR